jgi:hypothetical protein
LVTQARQLTQLLCGFFGSLFTFHFHYFNSFPTLPPLLLVFTALGPCCWLSRHTLGLSLLRLVLMMMTIGKGSVWVAPYLLCLVWNGGGEGATVFTDPLCIVLVVLFESVRLVFTDYGSSIVDRSVQM